MVIRAIVAADWEPVRAIYLEGIATGNATFETEAPTWEGWDSSHLPGCRLVAAESDNAITGWAALSAVSDRRVYAGVAEVSVYVAKEHQGQGLGRSLLQALITASEEEGIWTLQASMFPENLASIKLHKACGFRDVGRRERIGKMATTWRDTLLLERRSNVTGIR